MLGELGADGDALPGVEAVERALRDMALDARQALRDRPRACRAPAPGRKPEGEEAKAWPSTSGSASVDAGTLATRSVTAS